MNFRDILNKFRTESFTEKEKGTKFERLIKRWFETDPRYSSLLVNVWMWNEFPGRKDFGGKDIGIDLVAKTDLGDYWAIQCKCYAEDATIQKPSVDSFIATASRTFVDEETMQTAHFGNLIWVATTSHWGSNAEETLKNQTIPFTRINQYELEASPVDWELLLKGNTGKKALQEGKQPRSHQLKAMQKAHEYFANHDRGKMIMACGTGKTYTALKIVEQETKGKGLILYMVPSIALLGQGLNNWMTDTSFTMKAVCICSDPKAADLNYDDDEMSAIDTPVPASTNIESIKRQLLKYRNIDGLVVVFSTYQSIDVIAEAQKTIIDATNNQYGVFDYIVCDEAHRTTGLKQRNRDESNFLKIHNNDFIRGTKRLYMTATPRYYNASAKASAKEKDLMLWSMDNADYFGEEFYRIGFGQAVADGLLTDYKVLVLTVSEDDIPDTIKDDIKDNKNKELNFDDTTKLIGCINGLSKRIAGDNGITRQADPLPMHRAVAFCATINPSLRGGGISSTGFANILPQIASKYKESLDEEQRKDVVDIEVKHIDGKMNADTRAKAVDWLKEETGNPYECRILSNVRCLSEGIDVPALDAVIFVSARDSQVDVVQSVGRVMRSFHKDQPDEKKYGYIIVPVVIPSGADPNKVMEDNDRFKVVWDILNALRAHDDQFNATVNKIQLNKIRPPKVTVAAVPHGSSMMNGKDWMQNNNEEAGIEQLSDEDIAHQLDIKFGELQDGIYARMVEKVGDRLYWENWANKVGAIAQKFIKRIAAMVKSGEHKEAFNQFVEGLQENLNPSVDEGQTIEMLAQHMITRPVFDALFKDYRFIDNNPVSRSMQKMLDLLENEAMDKDTEVLKDFYDNVRINVGDIDNLEGKQTLIKTLYEKFFKGAFPTTVDKLGIVYTPVECVDFIIHSVDSVLRKEFDCCLSDENVHILDPFTGTGTFITRLFQSGLIRPEDMERKYLNEIHCNEIVLLAYYIADVNIESVFHEMTHRIEYLPYDGICLTDTFQTTENAEQTLDKTWFPENSKNVEKQRKAPIRVIIGNPPYSIGQKSANDNAQNQSYPALDERITNTYVAQSDAGLRKSAYDAYIKAFRWASDKISKNEEGGVISFISNGAWLDGNSTDGFRKCLEEEFDSIYVLNLRGNQRTSGELSRKEGGKIFGSGSRTPIAITILIKKSPEVNKAKIYYHDIGDYLSREQKLKLIKDFKSIESNQLNWTILHPNEHGDWINLRNESFKELIPLEPKKKFDTKAESVFMTYAIGLASNRDAWVYNFSSKSVENNMKLMINFYNDEVDKYQEAIKSNPELGVDAFVNSDSCKISWTVNLKKGIKKLMEYDYIDDIRNSLYRPFCINKLYYDDTFIERPGLSRKLFPTPQCKNVVICVSCVGSNKPITALITNIIPDLHMAGDTQCFPLYWYEKNEHTQKTLFDKENTDDYLRRDGVSDWILREVRNRFGGTKKITKETIFYYIYGLLHCKEYRENYASDLKKSLPRIPIVEDIDAFMDFSQAGRALAHLHLDYESIESYHGLKIIDNENYEDKPNIQEMAAEEMSIYYGKSEYDKYRVEKMRFPSKGKKDSIIYNSRFTITNIPAEAYEYVVNGKSAIEWIMERYAITIDKASQIKNDPNDWSKEHKKPRYILDLLLSVINVSVQTINIVKRLPKLSFSEDSGVEIQLSKDTESELNEIIEDYLPEEETTGDNDVETQRTLSLGIKQNYFDEIISGKKHSEYRQIIPYTYKRYLQLDRQGQPKCNPLTTVGGKVYNLNDENGGQCPFLAKQYSRLRLFVKDSQDTVTIEIRQTTFKYQQSSWWMEYHLGAVMDIKRKKR